MDEIIIINKQKGLTSRDVVNKAFKILNTKKIGHTGTLDPIATGVLVLCCGKATKLVELLTCDDKEYIATVKLGILTDTLDVDGNIIKKENVNLDKHDLIDTLNSFIGEYEQEVPIYSAVKIKGKKLYEYARENKDVILPKRLVKIKSIKLLQFSDNKYQFKVTVSKGTYIRSLIKDINDKLGIIGSMSDLLRIRQGIFDIKDSYTLEELANGSYKSISINDALMNLNRVEVSKELYDKIKYGSILNNIYNSDLVAFTYNGNIIAIYKEYIKDKNKIKPYKMFI